MTLKEIAEILEGEILCTGDNEDLEITSACGSDLMSDVMAFVKNSAMLLTGLLNMQVIRTAEMMDMRLIVFVRGKKPDPCVVEMAKQKGIALVCTKHSMFVACGLLYSHGLTEGGNHS
jgi:predicted transcriptional regulator